jgi:hypothetical protein
MSAWSQNTVAKQNVIVDLMELLLKTMEEEYTGTTANLDNYLTGFTDDNNNMNLDSLPSLEVDDELFGDNDVLVKIYQNGNFWCYGNMHSH